MSSCGSHVESTKSTKFKTCLVADDRTGQVACSSADHSRSENAGGPATAITSSASSSHDDPETDAVFIEAAPLPSSSKTVAFMAGGPDLLPDAQFIDEEKTGLSVERHPVIATRASADWIRRHTTTAADDDDCYKSDNALLDCKGHSAVSDGEDMQPRTIGATHFPQSQSARSAFLTRDVDDAKHWTRMFHRLNVGGGNEDDCGPIDFNFGGMASGSDSIDLLAYSAGGYPLYGPHTSFQPSSGSFGGDTDVEAGGETPRYQSFNRQNPNELTPSCSKSQEGMLSGHYFGAASHPHSCISVDEASYRLAHDSTDDLGVMPSFFHRVDSSEILYEVKKKRPKIIGGKYLMGEALGEGSYGKVKEALDATTLCRRAIKILKRRKLRKIPCGEQNVHREIKFLQRLKHPNVIAMFEVLHNDEKQKMYLVIEYCVGSLQEMLDAAPDKKFPLWQSQLYFTQLVDGLEYLHSQGIIHKDIKPGNLLLTLDETLKISDFGVAEELDKFAPDDFCGAGQGTPKFQAPEIAGGVERFSGFKVDVWSCGVTLYNFVSGSYPYDGETIYKLYTNICKDPLVIPADLDARLVDLLTGMLNKDYTQRFSVQRIKSHEWVLKKQPMTSERVPIPALFGDPLRNTTVVSYLEEYYSGESIGDSQGELISERDLKQLLNADRADAAQASCSNNRPAIFGHASSGDHRQPIPATSSTHSAAESSRREASSSSNVQRQTALRTFNGQPAIVISAADSDVESSTAAVVAQQSTTSSGANTRGSGPSSKRPKKLSICRMQ